MFAEWLKASRGGRSQEAIAAASRLVDPGCHVHQTRVSEWERGEGLPSFRQFVAICRALDLDEQATTAGRRLWETAQVPSSSPPSHPGV